MLSAKAWAAAAAFFWASRLARSSGRGDALARRSSVAATWRA
jgi:hypothetical protein